MPTYREKLKEEHPEAVKEYATGGAVGCPCAYGYEKGQPCKRKKMKDMSCRECWDREMEEGG